MLRGRVGSRRLCKKMGEAASLSWPFRGTTGSFIEVFQGQYSLGWVVPWCGISPLLGPDPVWLSSAWPSPLPAAAQSQQTRGVTPASRNGLVLRDAKLCLTVCLGRVGNSPHRKEIEGKKPRKINCRQYLIDVVSGAGTVRQATCKGGKEALVLSYPLYSLVLTMLPCLQMSPEVMGATSEGPLGHFCFCCFAHSLFAVRSHCQPHANAVCQDAAVGGLGPCWKHIPVSRPYPKDWASSHHRPNKARPIHTADSCLCWVTPLATSFLLL